MVGSLPSAGALRGLATTIRPSPTILRFGGPNARSISFCRRHEAQLRLNKESIRQRIRALEESRRRFTASASRAHGHIDKPKPGEELHVTFIDKDGDSHEFEVAEGANLLDIAQANDLEMEGACGGSCACSTCHVIVEGDDMYDKLEEADDDEVRTVILRNWARD
jgi:ferredoxin